MMEERGRAGSRDASCLRAFWRSCGFDSGWDDTALIAWTNNCSQTFSVTHIQTYASSSLSTTLIISEYNAW